MYAIFIPRPVFQPRTTVVQLPTYLTPRMLIIQPYKQIYVAPYILQLTATLIVILLQQVIKPSESQKMCVCLCVCVCVCKRERQRERETHTQTDRQIKRGGGIILCFVNTDDIFTQLHCTGSFQIKREKLFSFNRNFFHTADFSQILHCLSLIIIYWSIYILSMIYSL